MNQALAREISLFEQETSLRILVAEDDADLRRLLAAILGRDGHDVVEARDGAELLECLASTLIEPIAPFDLVVCEHRLPGMPGLTVLAGLRARDRTTPFVLVTDEPPIRDRARRLGAAVVDHLDIGIIRAIARRAAGMTPLERFFRLNKSSDESAEQTEEARCQAEGDRLRLLPQRNRKRL